MHYLNLFFLVIGYDETHASTCFVFQLSNTSEQIQDLQQELKETNKNLDNALEKLGISAASNLNRMVEVATHRDKVRDLEDDLEEVSENIFCINF